MIPNVLQVILGEDSVTATSLKKITYLFLGLSIVLLPLSLIRPKYYSWLVAFSFPLIIFEAFNIYQFRAPSSEEAIASVFLTNYGEASELIKGNFLSILFLFATLITLITLSFKIKKDFTLPKRFKLVIIGFFILVFTLLQSRNYLMANKLKDNFKEVTKLANYSLSIQLKKVYPTDVLIKLKDAYNGIQKKKSYLKRVEDFKFQAKKKDTLKEQEIYVLVIGETARKHNFSIYGYHRETSPNLDIISNLIPFTNANASANLTSLSIPFIVTRATPNNISPKLNEPAILTPFKEAGFKTYWITNQPSGIGSVFGFYSTLADYYKNTSVFSDALNDDSLLINELNNVLTDSSAKKKFIVIHTLGSHFRYNNRYPDEFEKFQPNLAKGLSIENSVSIKNKEKIINSYDNSILYTDHILSCFISILDKQNAVSFMYYISDHGENLYDDESNKLLHAFINPTKYELEIPLLIWNSNEYNQIYSSKISN
jgi:glucan phosphoethanolaminetransferase (alkaline phosphatase superfamily)